MAAACGVLLLVFTAVLLPLAIGSITTELLLPPEAAVYVISEQAPQRLIRDAGQRVEANLLDIAVVGIDEAKGLATLRVTGHRTCAEQCDGLEVIVFSVSGDLARRAVVHHRPPCRCRLASGCSTRTSSCR